MEKVYRHLEGTFHEIKGRLKVLTSEEVAELQRRKEELRSFYLLLLWKK